MYNWVRNMALLQLTLHPTQMEAHISLIERDI